MFLLRYWLPVSVVTTIIRPMPYKTLKSWLHVLHKNIKLYGITFTSMSIFVIKQKWDRIQLDILCNTCN